jgi:hypothetical protein
MEVNSKYPKHEVCMHWSGGRKSDNGRQQRSCKEYKYLGITLNQERTKKWPRPDDQEISNRITKAGRIITCLNGILWNKNITKKRKFNIHETMIKSDTMWLRNMETNRNSKIALEVTEMNAIRRSMRISWKEKVRNESQTTDGNRKFDNKWHRKERTRYVQKIDSRNKWWNGYLREDEREKDHEQDGRWERCEKQ